MNQILDTNSENKFISSKAAMVVSGYAKDYIGQLCRLQKIEARLDNGCWIVNLASLLDYKEKSALYRREKMRKEIWTSAENKEDPPRLVRDSDEASKIPQFLAKNRLVDNNILDLRKKETIPPALPTGQTGGRHDPWDQALLSKRPIKDNEPIMIPLRSRISSFSRRSVKSLGFAIILVLSGFFVWQHPELPSRVYTNLEQAGLRAVTISSALLHQTFSETQGIDLKVVLTSLQSFFETGPLAVGNHVGTWLKEKGRETTEALVTLITKTQEQVGRSIFSPFSRTFLSEEGKEDMDVLSPNEESPEIVVKEVEDEIRQLADQGLTSS
ncbi:hypothetical protein IIA94_01515, partial [Patescibacteria group bacterium]|nr:hypothetical protein [Patescibacteria group bacterium]